MRIFGRELRFGDPEPADIVIHDEVGSNLVRRALNNQHSVAVLKMRPEDIYIGLRVAWWFLRLLGQVSLAEAAKHPRGWLRGLFKQLRCIYIEACLVTMRPRAVVTVIDNCAVFAWLSRRCRRFPFIAIQNGSRLRYAGPDNPGYYLQHFLCFGTHERELFPQLGYEVENYYPVGSLAASLHYLPPPTDEKYDLLIVSTWRGNIGYQRDVRDTMTSMKIMDQLLAKYIQVKGIHAAIILRSERSSEHWFMPEVGFSEENYFSNIYGENVAMIETNFSIRNIFPLIQQSKIVVSCLSSALLEAFGIGKKVLYCNFTGTDRYHADIDPTILISNMAEDVFFERLDQLRAVSDSDYKLNNRQLARHYMSFPDGEPKSALQVIPNLIDELIYKHGIGPQQD